MSVTEDWDSASLKYAPCRAMARRQKAGVGRRARLHDSDYRASLDSGSGFERQEPIFHVHVRLGLNLAERHSQITRSSPRSRSREHVSLCHVDGSDVRFRFSSAFMDRRMPG